jgi:hypothetical protein
MYKSRRASRKANRKSRRSSRKANMMGGKRRRNSRKSRRNTRRNTRRFFGGFFQMPNGSAMMHSNASGTTEAFQAAARRAAVAKPASKPIVDPRANRSTGSTVATPAARTEAEMSS